MKLFIKYILIMCLCYIQDLGCFYLFNYLGVYPIYSNVLSKSIAIVLGFIVQYKIIFKQNFKLGALYKYLTLVLANFIVNNFCFAYLYHVFHLTYIKIFVDVLLMLINFILSKKYVY